MEEKDFSNLSDQNREELNQSGQNWNSASSIRGDDGYNPNSLASAENSAVSNTKTAEKDALSKETSPWKNNTGGTHKSRNLNSKAASFLKKKGAMLAAGAIGGGTASIMGIFGFLTTSMMPIHVKEIITEKMNSVAQILEKRSVHVAVSQMKGIKCGKIKPACRFETVTDKRIKKLEAQGFKVHTDESIIPKRKKITQLDKIDQDGNVLYSITGDNLRSQIWDNTDFRTSFQKAYSGRFASFLDIVSTKFRAFWGFLKVKADNIGKTEEQIRQEAVEKANKTSDKTNVKDNSQEEAELEEDTDEVKSQKRTKNDVIKKSKDFLSNINAKSKDWVNTKIGNRTAKITAEIDAKSGLVQIPCTLYSISNAVLIGVKVTRAIILAQFALDFLGFADKIKAGHATPEEATAMGNNLMATANDSSEGEKTEDKTSRIDEALSYFSNGVSSVSAPIAATDSQGWRAMAYDDSIGGLNDSAKQFSLGLTGFAVGVLKLIRDAINGASLGSAKEVCGVVNSWVGDIVDIGLTILSGGVAGALASVLAEQVIGMFIEHVLSSTIDVLAGEVVKKSTVGEDYGNATVSGSGSLMSKNTLFGGGSTLTKPEAVAFYQENERVITKNAAYERSIRSPFDASTRHTFLGSIVSSSLPYVSNFASFNGVFSSLFSIARTSFASISPGASAAKEAGFVANLEICKDEDMLKLNIALDPFCNPYTGISPEALDNDSSDTIEYLVNSGDLDASKGEDDPISAVVPGSKLANYIKNCAEREQPIGVGEEEADIGKECSTTDNPDVKHYAVFMTDVRVLSGMEEGLEPRSISEFASGGSSDKPKYISGNGEFIFPIEKDAVTGYTEYGHSTVPIHEGWHSGLDIWAPIGTPIYAVADGEVMMASPSAGCGPAQIEIRHRDDIYSVYCHNASGMVTVGQKVKKGQQIGTVGDEGYAKGTVPHLHIEITQGPPKWGSRSEWSLNRINPRDFIGS